jgi:hypothetical protein
MAVGFLNRTFALALELSGALELLKHPRLVLDFGARHFHAQFIVLSAFAVGASLISKASGWRLGGLASVGEGAVEGHLWGRRGCWVSYPPEAIHGVGQLLVALLVPMLDLRIQPSRSGARMGEGGCVESGGRAG